MADNNKPFSFEKFKELYSQVPRLCVDLVIKGPEGTLLTLRSIPPCKGMWHLPGGTVLMNEKLVDAASRVAQTELGIDITVEKLVGYIEFLNQELGSGVSVAFLCSADSDDFQLNDEADEARYFKDLPESIIPEHKAFLENL